MSVNKISKKEYWKRKWLSKYRLVVMDDSTFEEKTSFKLSRMNIFVFGSLFAFILITLTTVFIIYSPLRQYILGYTAVENKRETLGLLFKVDSLQQEIENNEKYLASIKKVLVGNTESRSSRRREKIVLVKQTFTMTKLSVNINKIATLRNARGGNMPDLLQVAKDAQQFGAEGITIHPRPDERHIRYQDAFDLLKVVTTEYNIEGNPIPKFVDLVLQVKPTQVTLVPDAEDAITSNAGWDTVKHKDFLTEVVAEFKRNGIRTSLFVDPIEAMVTAAAATGADRVELYTEAYAREYALGNKGAIAPYVRAAQEAEKVGLGLNAGHDLSLDNVQYFRRQIPNLLEVSIGHALICEALYLGLENVIQLYLNKLAN